MYNNKMKSLKPKQTNAAASSPRSEMELEGHIYSEYQESKGKKLSDID
jgi:hypothetical protein